MADVTVPTAPALASVPNVELMHVGQWSLSTGVATFTRDDLASAVAALDCPAVRRPVLKLGHTDPRFDGQPAVGWVDNMAVAADDSTLLGDYVGMPGWLGPVIASAYPDRSIEGCWDFTCQLGHTHPFVISAVALLGVTEPGIGTLQSLQDVAALYGVAAATAPVAGAVRFTVHAAKEAPMPNPQPLKVAATVTTEDVRRAFYDDAPWSVWIEEIQLDPMQLIVMNDDTGERSRLPFSTTTGAEGEDAVVFSTPVPVVIRYEDVPGEDTNEPLEQLAASKRVAFASRAESRPGKKPAAAGDPQTPAAEPVEPSITPQKEPDMSDTITTGLRERLGVTDADLDETGLLAALDEALKERAEPAAASTTPEIPKGKTLVSDDVLEELKISAKAGAEARARQLREDRDSAISAAVKAGKIAPARKEHWAKKWDTDPEGAKADLDSIEPGMIPVAAAGYTGGAEGEADETVYSGLFGDEKKEG